MIQSKSQLAKLMAAENITVEQRSVPTAFFNLNDRILTIPTFKTDISADLYDLFIGHEVSHALNTPPEGWHDAIVDLGIPKSVVNVCEDARIEKKIKRKFPGLKVSFTKGYREILDMDFFGLGDTEPNTLNLIDRINLECKCGLYFNLQFNDIERGLLTKVENTETFEDVIEVSKEIVAYMKELPKEEQDVKLTYQDTDGVGEEELDSEGELIDTEEDEEGDPSSSNGSDANEGDDEDEDQNGTEGGEDGDIESETDNSFREQEKTLYGKTKFEYMNVPDVDLNKVVIGHKELYQVINAPVKNYLGEPKALYSDILEEKLNEFRKSSGKTVSYLVKEFELRKNASQMAKASIAKTGDLNMKKVYAYNFTDDIFKRMTVIPNGKSHGLVLFLDWSGSMSGSIHETIKQLLTIVYFCKKVNIPYDVYAFSTQWRAKERPAGKNGDIVLNESFNLLNLLSSKMNATQFKDASKFLFSYYVPEFTNNNYITRMGLGGTPLNETVITSMKLIPKFQKDNKLDIVNAIFLTDGDGHMLSTVHDSSIADYRGNPVRSVNTWDATWVINDPITKESVSFRPNAIAQTKALLKLLKLRTGCNTTGFFIMRRSDFRPVYRSYKGHITDDDISRLSREFNKAGSFTLDDVGYDEYHLLRNDRLEIADVDFDDIEVETKTTKSLVSAFSKYSQNKLTNKVVLNRFISMIA